MGNSQIWINFLALLPSSVLTILLIAIAFLRFYDQTDFEFLGLIANPRQWSNGLTVAAVVATLANFGVEWNRRNRETNRLAEEAQRRAEEGQQRAEARERQIARAQIETRCRLAELRYQLDPSEANRQILINTLAVLEEYGEMF
ncbi:MULTISPECIES: hypothetical protein [unclassified Picosynechococcus]|uniref:hypothetical protein n=1 Tax=Cyanophyceae TaxID=3028117 RepID=UPI00016DC68A|nr:MULTISPECIES: hypothetical protein [unclassified Picosynechococcus]ACA98412.1 Conserved hypothetical protein [Picosynechococcus sp. PCC 7002]SMH46602.1 hypothetical protein SAMN06272755_1691 [Picosynechococcus sp. OG1]SMQ80813.1 hypothetical protein SAMN06272774_0970 [Synechococcus sp. 7002]